MTGDKDTAEKLLLKARVRAMSAMPFYGTLFLHLRIRRVEGSLGDILVPTAAVTPYGVMYYNAKFIEELDISEVQFVLAHEVMHVALMHLERMGNRERHKANIAADLAINNLIKHDFTIPHVLSPEMYDDKWKNMSFEEIYDKLPEPEECNGDCSTCPLKNGSGSASDYGKYKCKYGVFDKHITKEDIDKMKDGKTAEADAMGIPKDVVEQSPENSPEWRTVLNDALNNGRAAGVLPAGMERYIEDLIEPKLSWKEILAQFIVRSIPYDYQWRRPSRKSISSGFFMPSVKREEINVTICVDTSASITNDELVEFMSEVMGMIRTFENIKINLYSCDTMLSEVTKVGNEYDLQTTRLVGGGGTSYVPIFHEIRDNIEYQNTKVLIYFGDMAARFPNEDDVPKGLTTIWVVCKAGSIEAIPEFFPYKVKLE